MRFTIKDGVLRKCSLEPGETEVVIPDGVTVIERRDERNWWNCESVFADCKGMTSVVIPNSVEKIGDSSFKGCDSLTNIVIPDSVKEIGSHAFEGCTDLTSVVISDIVK